MASHILYQAELLPSDFSLDMNVPDSLPMVIRCSDPQCSFKNLSKASTLEISLFPAKECLQKGLWWDSHQGWQQCLSHTSSQHPKIS